MAGDALGPWWVSIGAGIVTTLLGTIAKLWTELATARRESTDKLAQKDAELADANDRIVELQREATERGDVHQREHVRDLRRIAGLSTSLEPPPRDVWPPVVIRATPPRGKPPPRKPG